MRGHILKDCDSAGQGNQKSAQGRCDQPVADSINRAGTKDGDLASAVAASVRDEQIRRWLTMERAGEELPPMAPAVVTIGDCSGVCIGTRGGACRLLANWCMDRRGVLHLSRVPGGGLTQGSPIGCRSVICKQLHKTVGAMPGKRRCRRMGSGADPDRAYRLGWEDGRLNRGSWR